MTNDELEAGKPGALFGAFVSADKSLNDWKARATRAEAHAEMLAAVMAEFIAAEDAMIEQLRDEGESVDMLAAPFPLVGKMRQALSAYRGEMKDG